jgi:hypothetical protein|tara:strand:+ start:271 stop:519 length:249 start_codon:yes stop_codon:yes gene_type:complete
MMLRQNTSSQKGNLPDRTVGRRRRLGQGVQDLAARLTPRVGTGIRETCTSRLPYVEFMARLGGFDGESGHRFAKPAMFHETT